MPPPISLTDGPVDRTLLRLALPMVAGIVAIMLFNIVDTWFIGQLGAEQLAAMTFTFPVVMVVNSVTMGIGVGASAVIARAIGQGDTSGVRRLTTDALLLAVGLVTVLASIGLATIDPLFTLLGAEPRLLPMIHDYIAPVYLGLGFLVIPMVGNAAIRATGDTKTPSVIMMCAGLVNLVLDPLLIFGIGPFPRLELFGGALATVISWVITLIAALWVLGRRLGMISFTRPSGRAVLASWRAILYVGLPAAATYLLVPFANGVLTRFVSAHGPAPVAGFGVGGRVESLALIAVMAVATGLAPFVGQNFGARRCDRIREALRLGIRFSLLWGLGMAALLAVLGPTIGGWFSDDPAVIETAEHYLWLVPISYGAYGVAMQVNTTFNALNRPLRSAALITIRLFVLALPLAWAGGELWGTEGIFAGLSIGNLAAGLVAYAFVFRFLRTAEEEAAAAPEPAPLGG
ncbi:MAG: MATE family efflux transporter [bacterium]